MSLYLDLLKEKVPKEQLYQKYAVELCSIIDCSKYFGITFHAVKALIDEYEITKDKNAASAARINKSSQSKKLKFDKIKDRVSKDVLYKFYIEDDNTYEETKQHFNLTEWAFVKLLSEYGIKKDRHISGKRGTETKYKNAGSKENYLKQSREKSVQTKIERYGSYEAYINHISSKCAQTWNSMSSEQKHAINARTMAHGGGWNKETIHQTLQEKYGVDNAYKLATKFQTNSKVNQSVADLLDAAGIEYSREFMLENKRFDFKVGNTLLEVNPWPFHNSSWCPLANVEPLDKNYHAEKSAIALRNTFRCIHIWEWDKLEVIIKLISNRSQIAARRCSVKQVDVQETKAFLNEYHVQGYARDSIRYGLYFNDELCAIMTFGKPRYNKKYEWELIRYCSKYSIVGGAEKLFKAFIRESNPQSIVSYCDRAKFSGAVYDKLGFNLIKNYPPSKHWYNIKTGQHITDNLLRQRGYDQLFGTDYGKGTSNEQLMLESQFVEIYDCGQSTYVWTNPNC